MRESVMNTEWFAEKDLSGAIQTMIHITSEPVNYVDARRFKVTKSENLTL